MPSNMGIAHMSILQSYKLYLKFKTSFSHQCMPARVTFNFMLPYRLPPNVNKWLYPARVFEEATSQKAAEPHFAIICIKIVSWDPKLICIFVVCFLCALPFKLLLYTNPSLPQQVTNIKSPWYGGRRDKEWLPSRVCTCRSGCWWLRWNRRMFGTNCLILYVDTWW